MPADLEPQGLHAARPDDARPGALQDERGHGVVARHNALSSGTETRAATNSRSVGADSTYLQKLRITF